MRELIHEVAAFKDDAPVLDHIVYVWSEDESLYYTECPPSHRLTLADLDPSADNCRRVPREHRFPPWKIHFTPASAPNTADYYLKSPSILGYNGTDFIAQQFEDEIETMELLSRNLHPNVITYLGCKRDWDLATGIWLDRHDYTLYDLVEGKMPVNRQVIVSLVRCISNDRCRRPASITQIISGIQAGLAHVHSLGLVHDDINPANILLDKDNQPIIIDFGCCARQGQKSVGGTPEWYQFPETAEFANDFYGLELIEKWLEEKYLRGLPKSP